MTDPSVPQLSTNAKAWAGFTISLILSLLGTVSIVLATGEWGPAAWLAIAVSGVTSVGTGLGVYRVSNAPKSAG